jgi:hypothetical protein
MTYSRLNAKEDLNCSGTVLGFIPTEELGMIEK